MSYNPPAGPVGPPFSPGPPAPRWTEPQVHPSTLQSTDPMDEDFAAPAFDPPRHSPRAEQYAVPLPATAPPPITPEQVNGAITAAVQGRNAIIQAQNAELAHLRQAQLQSAAAPGYPAPRTETLKLAQPSRYDGKQDDNACEDWITEMREYIEYYAHRGHFRDESKKIMLAGGYLKDQARRLWSVRKKLSDEAPMGSSHKIDSLNHFFDVIRHACKEVNGQERIRADYNTLRQHSSVSDYAYDLLGLADQLVSKPPDSEVLERFKVGLQPHVQDRLAEKLDLPTELFAYINLADRIDRNWYEHCWMRRRDTGTVMHASAALNVLPLRP
ncbi:hypothetical protein LPUS_10094 [Lasallia pustulata]|uniref:Retrotransposon gag domain n=1 Tax=Lasallia pustulata TaxID=136370 RepID=A0A1W5D8U2_9LECA|nr:hypothetical protein LPUS_10094 [Lasallia pustulata]